MDKHHVYLQVPKAVSVCSTCIASVGMRRKLCSAGDTGLEIAPGKDVDENPDLHIIGNIWNAVPTAKTWTPLDPIEGAITVNIGDGLQYWTDGLFKSTYHRVRAPKDGDNKVSPFPRHPPTPSTAPSSPSHNPVLPFPQPNPPLPPAHSCPAHLLLSIFSPSNLPETPFVFIHPSRRLVMRVVVLGAVAMRKLCLLTPPVHPSTDAPAVIVRIPQMLLPKPDRLET